MNIGKLGVYAVVGLLPCSFGCTDLPDLDDRLDENVVITQRDPAADFASYRTFALTPVRAVEVGLLGNTTDVELEPAIAEALQARVSELMTERGYQRVERDQMPELGLGIGVVQGTRSVSVSNNYWGNYYGSYWGYPTGSYYPYSFNYVYRTGSLALTLLDLRAGEAAQPGLRAIWAALIYRAMPKTDLTVERVDTTLEQAFQQSPYLSR
jgi:hypothetical protein